MKATEETYNSIEETIKKIFALAEKYKISPLIRKLAVQLTQNLTKKDYKAEQLALASYIKDKVRYVADVKDVETLQNPELTLGLKYREYHSGDCDDHTISFLALAYSIGQRNIYPCTISTRVDKAYEHIFIITDYFIIDTSERDIYERKNELKKQLPYIYQGITKHKVWGQE